MLRVAVEFEIFNKFYCALVVDHNGDRFFTLKINTGINTRCFLNQIASFVAKLNSISIVLRFTVACRFEFHVTEPFAILKMIERRVSMSMA